MDKWLIVSFNLKDFLGFLRSFFLHESRVVWQRVCCIFNKAPCGRLWYWLLYIFVLSLDCESNDHSNANDMNLFAKSLRLYMLLWPGLLRRDQNRTIRQTSHCLDVVWRGFNPTWQLHQNTSELACNVMLVTLQSQCDFKHLDDSVHWIWKTVRRASVVSTCYRYTCCSRVCLSPGIAGEKRRKIGFISASLPPHRWRSVLGRCGVVFVHPQSVDPQCHPTE